MIIVFLIILLFGSNIAWLVYEAQFQVVEESHSQIVENVQTVHDISQK